MKVFFLFLENVVARPQGNPPVNYWSNLGDYLNLLTGMPFLLDGTVVGWVYYMGTGRYCASLILHI